MVKVVDQVEENEGDEQKGKTFNLACIFDITSYFFYGYKFLSCILLYV